MTLNGYSSDDAVRQIRFADGEAANVTAVEDFQPEVAIVNYLRAIAVALAAIAARMEE